MAALSDASIAKQVSLLVKDCENYRDELSKDRMKAMEYYDGTMADVKAGKNRSAVVSRDVSSASDKAVTAIARTILGGDKIVEYAPVKEGDEEIADQATDYINYIVFPESGGEEAVEDTIFDAVVQRNGIMRVWWDKRTKVSVSRHTGLSEDEVIRLASDDGVEVIGKEVREEQIDTPQGPQMIPVFDLKIRRKKTIAQPKLGAVKGEEFLIHPDALTIEDSPIVGINTRYRRSDLIAMGYDREIIDSLPPAGSDTDKDTEDDGRRREIFDRNDSTNKALEEVEYYELYVRIDADDDGIAELRRMVFAGYIQERYMLENEECDDVPFAEMIVKRRPHQREGNSIPDDTMEIQRVKTVLLRETLDNIYWQNSPQPVIQEGAILNPDSILSPSFGKPIRVSEGIPASEAYRINIIPFVASQSFEMMAYFDSELTDRTGISDASSGLAPDALQNMTAKASAMIEQGAVSQTERMARTYARGLKRVFKLLLRLIIKHQDKPRIIRLRDKWVSFDPRQWNADMDCTVNTGLGAGTRERDMMMMQLIGQQQEKLLAAYGPMNNPFVSPDNIWNSISRGVQAAGLKTPETYFTKPTPEALQQFQQQQASQPDPAMEKIKVEQQKAQAKVQMDAQKAQTDAQIEMERMNREFELKRYQIDREIELKQKQTALQAVMHQPVQDARIGGMPG